VLVPGAAEAEETARELGAYLGEERVLPYPSLEVAPYERIAPHAPAVHDRMRALHRLAAGEPVAVVASVEAAFERTLPPESLRAETFALRPGDEVRLEALARRLTEAGYARLPASADPGDFSVRGGIVDLFSPAHPCPARIVLDGDRVESLRWFDPASQRTTGPAPELVVLPCSPVVARAEALAAAAAGLPDDLAAPLRQGIRFHGVESLLPRLWGRAAPLFEYLGRRGLVAVIDSAACAAAWRNAFAEAEENYAVAGEEAGFPAPAELYLAPEELPGWVARFPVLSFDGVEVPPLGRREALRARLAVTGNEDIRRSTATASSEGLLYPLVTEAKAWWKRGDRFAVTALTPSQRDRLGELLARYDLPVAAAESLRDFLARGRGIGLVCSPVARGFRFQDMGAAVVTEAELFGGKARVRRARREAPPAEEFTLRDLRVNDLVVHVDHGVGIYRGLMRRTAGGVEGDFLVVEYAGGDRLFVPVEKMGRVQRYAASGEERPRLAKLGGTAWQRAKRRVKDSLLSMAADLIALQARRQLAVKTPLSPPDEAFREFEAAFDHEETPDQQRAIAEVLADLCSARPMDRLVCGDVGYGKTEVAIRAAYKAALDGRQVAVLVPTTVLAEQHHRTFLRRLAACPVRVENLSRFRSRAEQAAVLADLAAGRVDIVIGTHRLLQKDVVFRNLGLVVIDEEQRFGVAHKEKLKRFRAEVDVLTLSATPIPRTLHMAFSGIRDISVIATPPEDRLAIRTFVLPFGEEAIREAVEREVRRGGQVFFVHNRVETLPRVERLLRELLPHVRIAVAHGQMEEGELAAAMDDFAARRADLLLCTAIIESGLDIANANTIVINEAHRFGLAQLYQLRGRVGRDRHRAYAYLLVPPGLRLTPEACKRLGVIEELTELGSGFRIASYDLEIRGAGNLLGRDQSGHIHQVGYELYTQLLAEAVAELSGQAAASEEEPELDLRIPAFLPDDYIVEPAVRLDFYRRLAAARTEEAVDDVELELADRFGRLPAPAEALCALSRLRAAMRAAGVRELRRGDGRLFLSLSDASPVDRGLLARWVTQERGTFSFARGGVLAVRLPQDSPREVLAAATNLLKRLGAGR